MEIWASRLSRAATVSVHVRPKGFSSRTERPLRISCWSNVFCWRGGCWQIPPTPGARSTTLPIPPALQTCPISIAPFAVASGEHRQISDCRDSRDWFSSQPNIVIADADDGPHADDACVDVARDMRVGLIAPLE